MEPSTPYVQGAIIIRHCPRQKRLGLLVHISTRKNPLTEPLLFSTTKTCHPYIMGYPQTILRSFFERKG
jgi:hypothetical protein